ncbi:MAG: hypothetical protein NC044_08920, partial [Prevotella sp.]|nr:hypothetical protein [Bacteroides sp.]MCM1446509.1 hypothetical protein [Prevotella sp.]
NYFTEYQFINPFLMADYINDFAFVVEGDYLYLIFFESAVGVEGDAAYVCHDFEVLKGFYFVPEHFEFYTAKVMASNQYASTLADKDLPVNTLFRLSKKED